MYDTAFAAGGWPTLEFGTGDAGNDTVAEATERLTAGVSDLIGASSALDTIQTELRALVANLGELRERAAAKIAKGRHGPVL